MQKNIIFLLLAALLALSLVMREGISFVFAIFFIILTVLLVFGPKEDRHFLAIVFALAFLIRIIFAYLLHWQSVQEGWQGWLAGDERLYSLRALKMVMISQKLPYNPLLDIPGGEYGVNPFTYILAAYYRLFSPYYFGSKLINCLIGSVSPLVVFFLGKKIFSSSVARVAFILSAFYPSMIGWSICNLKDPFIIFLIVACVYLIVTTFDETKQRLLKLAAIPFLLWLIKDSQILNFYAVIGALIFFALYKGLKHTARKTRYTIVIVLSAVVLMFAGYMVVKPLLLKQINVIMNKNMQLAMSGNSNYQIYSAEFAAGVKSGSLNIKHFAGAYLKGVSYFLLSPFPWRISSPGQLMAYPQNVLWYFLLFFSIFGFAGNPKPSIDKTVFIIFFILIGVSLWSLSEANIGAAFRHRDYFSPLVFIYSSAGIIRLFCDREKPS